MSEVGGLEAHSVNKSFYYLHAFFGTVLVRMPGLRDWRGLPAPVRGCFASAELAEPALSMLLRTAQSPRMGTTGPGRGTPQARPQTSMHELVRKSWCTGAQANAWDA